MAWRVAAKNTGRHVCQQLGTSVGIASLAVLGLTGAAAQSLGRSAAGFEPDSMAAIATVPTGQSVALSFNLFEFIGNVFRYIQVSNISDAEEVALGRRINDMMLSQQYQLYGNNQVQSYVNRIGQRLVSASDSRDIPFNFQVVASDEVNAFAVPGGYVYVTTGLLQVAENEAQLASVLAHEISHINERHSIEAIKRAALAQGIAETANIETNNLAQIGYQLTINLPRSRDFEYAADEGGLEILRQAGYPPMAFVDFLEVLESAAGTPEFLRTHPTSANRIEELRNQIAASDDPGARGMQENAYENAIEPLD